MSTTPYVPSITIDAVMEALGAFLQPFVGTDTPIIRAHQNRVPPPLDPFVLLNEVVSVDLETPRSWYNSTEHTRKIIGPTRIDIQIDIYGPSAGDQCKAIKGVFRTPYAAAQFPANIQPLYCSDATMTPLVTGEEQYDERWILTASLQYNPIVTIPQQSADALSVIQIKELP